jgi:hypothetical protein
LQGQYFFLDSRNDAATGNDNYWMFDPADPFGTVDNIDSELTPNVGSAQFPVSFGEDANGNLYIAYIASGEVYRILTNELLPGDYNADGNVDDDDQLVWEATFGATGAGLPADGNADGTIDAADYVVWRTNFGASVHELPGGGSAGSLPEPHALMLIAPLIGSCFLARRSRPAPATCS